DVSKSPESNQQNSGITSRAEVPPNQSSEPMVLPQFLEILAPAAPIRLAVRGSRQVALELRNGSSAPQSGRIRLKLPGGVLAEPSDGRTVTRGEGNDRGLSWALPEIGPNQTTNISFLVSSDGTCKPGFYPAMAQATGTSQTSWTPPIALPITLGAVLVEDNSFPTFGEYVIYAPRYTFRMSKRYGTSRFLRDDANRPRCEATFWDRRPTAATTPDAIPRLRVDDKDALAWGEPAQFLWPNIAPASVTVGAGRSRLAWDIEDDAV